MEEETAKDMLLRDALEEAIRQEHTIIKMRRTIIGLCIILAFSLIAMMCFAIM